MTTPVKKTAAPRKTTAKKAATPVTPSSPPIGKPSPHLHRRGKGQFSTWADSVADSNITSVDELYEFLEDTRAFFQEASSLVEVLAKQFDHDLKLTMKKKDTKFAWLGISVGGRFKKTVREMNKIADACEAAAKHAYACWTAYEKDSLEMQEEVRAAEIAAKHGGKGTGGFDHGF